MRQPRIIETKSIGKARYGHWKPSLPISVLEEFVKFFTIADKEVFWVENMFACIASRVKHITILTSFNIVWPNYVLKIVFLILFNHKIYYMYTCKNKTMLLLCFKAICFAPTSLCQIFSFLKSINHFRLCWPCSF